MSVGFVVGAVSNLAIERTAPVADLKPPALRRNVRMRVQARRVAVAGITALLFGLAWTMFGHGTAEFVVVAAFAAVFLILAVVDLETLYIPDVLIYPSLLAALAFLPFRAAVDPLEGIAGLVIGYSVFLPFAWFGDRTGRDLMGWGDVKFTALLGAVLGVQPLLVGLYLGVLIGGIAAVVVLISRGSRRRQAVMPYGPSLATGGVIALFGGGAILDWAPNAIG